MSLIVVQSLLLAACASAGNPMPPEAVSPTAPPDNLKDRRMSEFTPDFADKPYDLTCGQCDYEHAIDVCKNLGRSSAVLRASVDSESPPATNCEVINEHNRASRCSSDTEVTLKDVQILRGTLDAAGGAKVRARFTYMRHGEPLPRQFLSRGTFYFLFIYPNKDRQSVDTDWMALAICPVVESH